MTELEDFVEFVENVMNMKLTKAQITVVGEVLAGNTSIDGGRSTLYLAGRQTGRQAGKTTILNTLIAYMKEKHD